jgi:hypothetical protein
VTSVHYDLNGDGNIQSTQRDHPEVLALSQSAPIHVPKALNIVIISGPCNDVGRDGRKGVMGWVNITDAGNMIGRQIYVMPWYSANPSNGDAGYNVFKNVCAHEAGHALRLSTRHSVIPGNRRKLEDGRHDYGVFPLAGTGRKTSGYYMEDGLMFWQTGSFTQWLRHEDWIAASARAVIYYLEQQ